MNFLDPILPPRFWDKIQPEPNSGCWLWIGSTTGKGYGSFNLGGKPQKTGVAHKMTCVAGGISFPSRVNGVRMVVDHACRTRCCVNPTHLEAVAEPVNVARGISPSAKNQAKTHCPREHEYNETNTYIWKSKISGRKMRSCRFCRCKDLKPNP